MRKTLRGKVMKFPWHIIITKRCPECKYKDEVIKRLSIENAHLAQSLERLIRERESTPSALRPEKGK